MKLILFFAAICPLLVAGQETSQTKGCVCAYNTYTIQDTQMALQTARVTRPGDFPVRFWNVQGFQFAPFCTTGPYRIFPLRQGIPWNDNIQPRADRLVYSEINGQFCGCITHSAAPRKGFFYQCQVSAS